MQRAIQIAAKKINLRGVMIPGGYSSLLAAYKNRKTIEMKIYTG